MKLLPDRVTRGFRLAKLALAAGYRAASTTITRIKGWTPSNRDANSLIFADGEMLRARSRSLVRENHFASGALSSIVANVIGSGIQPISKHPDTATRSKIEAAWLKWTDEADAAGVVDFYGLQRLAFRAMRQDGEVFIRIRYRLAKDGLTVPIQFQILEADHVPYWKNEILPNGNLIRAGIEFNILGQRIAYHMYREHPGGIFLQDAQLYRIPAEQVIHMYEVERPGQLRGEPWLTPAIVLLYDIDQFLDATILRAKIANLLSVFIKKINPGEKILSEKDNKDGTAVAALQPGTVNYLQPDEEPITIAPPNPGAGLQDFMRVMLRAVARALKITYEQLSGDLTGVSFSSIRAGKVEFQRWCEALQHQCIIFQLCRPVWDLWKAQAALNGVLDLGDMAANPNSYDVDWQPPGFAWVDPEAEVAANKAAVRSGFASRRQVVALTGSSISRVDLENSEDNRRAEALGLVYDSNGANPDKGVPSVKKSETALTAPGAAGGAPSDINPAASEFLQ